MRSQKRYTNSTFTKRVDHEAGRHHTPRGAAEPAVCATCGAVYADRRWIAAGVAPENKKHKHWRPAQTILCPACKQKRQGTPGGYVHLDGDFLSAHFDEIERLLRNEAERAGRDNPLARILAWQKGDARGLTLTTTTEHLAQRLGHALEKAFSGEVRYDFSHENKLAHVYWHRD